MVEGDDVIFQLSKNLVSKNNSMQLTREYSIFHHPKRLRRAPFLPAPVYTAYNVRGAFGTHLDHLY